MAYITQLGHIMYYPKVNLSSEQLDLMIAAIDLEYSYTCNEELAELLSTNFDVDYVDILAALTTHKVSIPDDFEQISNEHMYYGATAEL